MNETPLNLSIIWHMHQPFYKDLVTGQYVLPWVRLHAIKDYYSMVSLLDDFPDIKLTFNLVPSLLEQIEEYAGGKAKDYYLELTLKKPAALSIEEKVFLLRNFFSANRENMIRPYPRYAELLNKRGDVIEDDPLLEIQRYFTDQEFLDLQVWFNLSWFEAALKEGDGLLRQLIRRDRLYSEEDKINLINKQLSIISLIINKYKDLYHRGQIELITSPFYHPILPLLCDSFAAKEAIPEIVLPEMRFNALEDATEQVDRSIRYFNRLFGFPPKGMWPSEGSVSPEAVSVMHKQGIEWLATDEQILSKSLNKKFIRDRNGILESPETLYQVYRYNPDGPGGQGEKGVDIIFRDHFLSDLIGFVYPAWDAQEAADDFVLHLEQAQKSLKQRNCSGIASVILDGENAWEYYQNNGRDFLKALYDGLSGNPAIKTCTVSQYLAENTQRKPLTGLFSGSWINHNFKIWIGHPEDNKAWNYLAYTREDLVRFQNSGRIHHDNLRNAWKALYIAEGSDWFWWYGDEHPGQDRLFFDYLFRRFLTYIYQCLGEAIPDYLFTPIISRQGEPCHIHKEPKSFIWPEIDGEVSNYFDWYGAGVIKAEGSTVSMHQSARIIQEIYYGFNLNDFFMRLDFYPGYDRTWLTDSIFNFYIGSDESYKIKLAFQIRKQELVPVLEFLRFEDNVWQSQETSSLWVAVKEIVEMAIPLRILHLKPNQKMRFNIVVETKDQPIERHPSRDFFSIHIPDKDFEQIMWEV